MNLTIVLHTLPPREFSANQSSGKTYRAKQGAKARSLKEVKAALDACGWDWGRAPIEKAKVAVMFYLPTRHKRDHGSLVERMKPVWDALTVPTYYKDGRIAKKGHSVLRDDDLTCMGWPYYSHKFRPRLPGTIITILEIKENI